MTEPTHQQFLEFAKGKAIAAMIDAGLNPVEGDVELLAMFMMRGGHRRGEAGGGTVRQTRDAQSRGAVARRTLKPPE